MPNPWPVPKTIDHMTTFPHNMPFDSAELPLSWLKRKRLGSLIAATDDPDTPPITYRGCYLFPDNPACLNTKTQVDRLLASEPTNTQLPADNPETPLTALQQLFTR